MNNNKKIDINLEEENDFCDLDNTKICDNCCKCIETDANYKIIKITDIITEEK